jgi:hypothetical protein
VSGSTPSTTPCGATARRRSPASSAASGPAPRGRGVRTPYEVNTPYLNTVPVSEQPPFPATGPSSAA